MPWYIGDYLADTMHLGDAEAHGAYLLLIATYWRNGGPLVDENYFLRSSAKLSDFRWKKLRPTLAKFFTVEDGVWRHKRIDHELQKAELMYDVRREASRVANEARWGDKRSATQRGPRSVADIRAGNRHGSQPQPHTKILPSYTAPRASAGHEGRAAHGGVARETKRERVVKPTDVVVTTSAAPPLNSNESPIAESLAKLREARVLASLRSFHGKDEAARIWAGYTKAEPDPDCVKSVEWISKRDGISAS